MGYVRRDKIRSNNEKKNVVDREIILKKVRA